ncbi:cache domain-containing protein [Vibrio sp. JC009]|uniref:sensor domain-containing diguanylate cyclase n=1 Tax=Vibrio sp. JC009 TaxID=2912314 RepID=UPI0023B00619|nr:cache domain-containing protein [Vibrio sp. JC009]WED22912.1 cache domain-containing protein [Vibrio sp. JC009]
MEQIYDKKLLSFIKYTPMILIGLATAAIIANMFHDNRKEAVENLESLHTDYTQREKTRVQLEVESVYQQLVYEKARTELELKKQIKQRVYEAHTIASNIYQNNKDKSEAEITKQITDALRYIRFNDNRGYYFIYKMDGTNVLLPHLSEREGTSLWDMQDSRGSYIIHDLASVVKNKGEGYHRWWFFKPQDLEQDLEKIGFVKYFEPLDWFIGTGEYIRDFEKDTQKRLLSWISEIRFGESGYVFVVDTDANILAHPDPEIRGTQGFNLHDSRNKFYVREIIETAMDGGGFVNYEATFVPEGVERRDKVSYTRLLKPWNWVLGSGFYESEVESYLAAKEREIADQNDAELVKLILFSFLIASVMFVCAAYISGRLSTRFKKFQAQINHDFSELTASKNQMQYMALFDSLTDLPNRVQFTQTTRKHVQEAESSGRLVAIALLDIDNFKEINDIYGFAFGDKLLQLISRHFKTVTEQHDIVSRHAGDQFIFCFSELVKKSELQDKLDILRQIFSEKFTIDDKSISVSCTMGVVTYPEGGITAEELISNADIAVFRAKGQQKGGVLYYEPSMALEVEFECENT